MEGHNSSTCTEMLFQSEIKATNLHSSQDVANKVASWYTSWYT